MSKQPLMVRAENLAATMFDAYSNERQCPDLLIEWAKDAFWGKVIEQHLPVFDEVYGLLAAGNFNSGNTSFNYGDADGSVWMETIAKKKIIIHTSHCTCNDANTTIYIMEDSKILPGYNKFFCVEALPRKKGRKPSLATHRKAEFAHGYQDGRDEGHIFKYDGHDQKVDKATWTEMKIPRVLADLNWLLECLLAPAEHQCL